MYLLQPKSHKTYFRAESKAGSNGCFTEDPASAWRYGEDYNRDLYILITDAMPTIHGDGLLFPKSFDDYLIRVNHIDEDLGLGNSNLEKTIRVARSMLVIEGHVLFSIKRDVFHDFLGHLVEEEYIRATNQIEDFLYY